MVVNCEYHYVTANGIRLHVAQAGPKNGPLLILLHGFPEFWYGWRKQIPYFAGAGYRVWAPDGRGYNWSDKPHGLAAYNLDVLAADVVSLLDAAGREKAYLAGHDWGGAVAWWVAAKHPQRLHRLAVINCPHGSVLQKALRRDRAQQRRQWYIFFFQLPWLPEVYLRQRHWRALARTLRGTSRRGTFSAEDLVLYREAWAQPGAITGMLNWYRAMFRQRPSPPPRQPITVPTLLIWGAQDHFLARELAQPSIERCADGRLVFIEDATHWVHHERPERVNALLHEFFSAKIECPNSCQRFSAST